MANGFCDNLLLASYLSATCPVVVAPAMDEDMWMHPSTKKNLLSLTSFGNSVISVAKGELASGLFGEGRMAEPEEIIQYLKETFFRKTVLKNRKALVTAGPTHEAIDPVRFIGNHSSGKMGFAVAEALYELGAEVTLVTGPTNEIPGYKGIQVKQVTSAHEMYDASVEAFEKMDIAVMAAAVADYRVEEIAREKIKKSEEFFSINLTRTKDILKTLGHSKKPGQIVVGFALETNNEKENALKKLHSKNADFIVLNSLQDDLAGFKKDTNKVTIFSAGGQEFSYEAKDKKLVAKDIVDLIIKELNEKA
jgi:phosphopantothenoylcysteine decarboxylase/phosphopantothenate--cysteine ligase